MIKMVDTTPIEAKSEAKHVDRGIPDPDLTQTRQSQNQWLSAKVVEPAEGAIAREELNVTEHTFHDKEMSKKISS